MVEQTPLCWDDWGAGGDHSRSSFSHFSPERLHKYFLFFFIYFYFNLHSRRHSLRVVLTRGLHPLLLHVLWCCTYICISYCTDLASSLEQIVDLQEELQISVF